MNPLLLATQFGWYSIVGSISAIADIGGFIALDQTGMPVLLASASSFIIATLVNYYLCYKLAFIRGRFNRPREIARLFMVAVVGLGLNTLFVWLFISSATFPPVIAKIAAIPLVLAWNFLGRRHLVFHKPAPPAESHRLPTPGFRLVLRVGRRAGPHVRVGVQRSVGHEGVEFPPEDLALLFRLLGCVAAFFVGQGGSFRTGRQAAGGHRPHLED